MPQVGKKHFAYSKKGKQAAKKEAAKTGMPMKIVGPMPKEMKHK